MDGLVDLGAHRLKDLSASERVYQSGEGVFPRLKTLYQTNLPVPPTALVGRKKELADLRRLLTSDDLRVVTLTGPGGIGKTRLGLAAAGESAGAFPDGVWFVDLAPLGDAELVRPAIADAVGAEGDLEAHLVVAESLLVLDNFEHLTAAAFFLGALLAACPRVRALVTSREPLRIAIEREYALRPLPESPAVELFRQRVAAVAPERRALFAATARVSRCSRRSGNSRPSFWRRKAAETR